MVALITLCYLVVLVCYVLLLLWAQWAYGLSGSDAQTMYSGGTCGVVLRALVCGPEVLEIGRVFSGLSGLSPFGFLRGWGHTTIG